MSVVQKVAVLGGTGSLGELAIPALIRSGFTVTVISRPGGRCYAGPNASATTAKEAAYDDVASLTAALRGHDALLEAFNPASTVYQRTIVQAALAAGIKILLTNEFGYDTFHPNIPQLPTANPKVVAQKELEEELRKAGDTAQLTWTGIFTGIWFYWAIPKGYVWVDLKTKTVTRYGSGNQKVSFSRTELIGDAVVAVLREPEKFKNRPAYFASHSVSTNEVIHLLEEVSGESWTVVDVPDVEGLRKEGLRLWDEDRKNGVEDWLHSKAYLLIGRAAFLDENNQFGGDYGNKVEPGWEEGREELKEQLRKLIEETAS